MGTDSQGARFQVVAASEHDCLCVFLIHFLTGTLLIGGNMFHHVEQRPLQMTFAIQCVGFEICERSSITHSRLRLLSVVIRKVRVLCTLWWCVSSGKSCHHGRSREECFEMTRELFQENQDEAQHTRTIGALLSLVLLVTSRV